MATKERKVIETVEQLAQFVFANPNYNSTIKWHLDDRFQQEWVDSDTGHVFYREDHDDKGEDPIYVTTLDDGIRIRMKQSKLVHVQYTTWQLHEAGDSYHGKTLWLSAEFGTMLDKVWKHENKYGWDRRSNYPYTIPQMLKKLGSNLDGAVKDAVARAKAADEKQKRNNGRNYAVRNLREALETIKRSQNEIQPGHYSLISIDINAAIDAITAELED